MKTIVWLARLGVSFVIACAAFGQSGAGARAVVGEAAFDLVLDEPRGRLYASDPVHDVIDVYALSDLTHLGTIQPGNGPVGMDLSPDGQELAVALRDEPAIAFVNLNATHIVTRVLPALMTGAKAPYDVLYGKPGRLYTTGNPGSGGIDYVHVFDTLTKLEVGHTGFPITEQPTLALAADQATLYVGTSSSIPNHITRLSVITDTPQFLSENLITTEAFVGGLCVLDDGRVATARGQVWSADLSDLTATLPASGSSIACVSVDDRIYIGGDSAIWAIDALNGHVVWRVGMSAVVNALEANAAGTVLFASTAQGIQRIGTDIRPRVYVAQVQNSKPGINGRVTTGGTPRSNVALELWRLDQTSATFVTSTVSLADGGFAFLNAATLPVDQSYLVRFHPTAPDMPEFLSEWLSREIVGYVAGTSADLGEVDLGNVGLIDPTGNAVVSLPYTFQWAVRSRHPEESYIFTLLDSAPNGAWFESDPALGAIGSYTLTTLPGGFTAGRYYLWNIQVLGADGSYGVSSKTLSVYFQNTGGQALPALIGP